MRRKWFSNGIFAVIEAICFFPVLLAAGIIVDRWVAAGPELAFWWANIAVCALAGVILRPFPWPRWLMILIGAAVACTAAAIGFGPSPTAVGVVAVLGGTVFLRALLLDAEWYAGRSVMYWIGLAVHFFGYIPFRYVEWLQPYLSWVIASGLLSILISVFMTNRESLLMESFSKGDKRKVSQQTKRINRFMLFVLLIVLSFIVFYGPILDALQAMFRQLVQWLASLFEGGEEPLPLEPQPGGPMEMLLPPAEEKDNWFTRLSELLFQLLMYVVYAALVVGVLFLLYVLVKKAAGIWRRISAWLAERFQGRSTIGGTEGFVDEEIQLLDLQSLGRSYMDKLRELGARLRREPPPKDNKERLRRMYRDAVRDAIKAGYTFKPHFTPKETLKDMEAWSKRHEGAASALGTLYYKARYSIDEISDEDLRGIDFP